MVEPRGIDLKLFSVLWLDFIRVFVACRLWLKIVYHLQFAQYVSATLFLLFGWSTRMPSHEKLSVLLHHLVQILLVGFCFAVSEHRMGSALLLIHDLSTPFYEASNMLRYIGWEEMASIVHMVYALTYVVTRMIAFPLRVILAIPMHFPAPVYYAFTTCGHPAANGGCLAEPLFTINYYYIWISLLILLYLTHLHWSLFIARAAKKSLSAASKRTVSRTHNFSEPTQPEPVADEQRKPRKLMNSQRSR